MMVIEVEEASNRWNKVAVIFVDWMELVRLIGKVEFMHCSREVNEVEHEK